MKLMRIRQRHRLIAYLLAFLLLLILVFTTFSSNGQERLKSLEFIPSQTLAKGLKLMKTSRIIFVGISRDNGDDVNTVLTYIKITASYFLDYRIIIFENDSKDNTLQTLERFRANDPKLVIISKSFKNVRRRASMKFLGDARNFYINEMRKPEYDTFDYVMMVELDLSYGWDVRSVIEPFSKVHRWDVSCANGISDSYFEMYDKFAFRRDKDNRTDVVLGQNDFSNLIDYWEGYLPSKKFFFKPTEDILPVKSCFGGLVLYKKKIIGDCVYDSIKSDCEHVLFHECIRVKNNGTIVLNPTQVLRHRHYFWDNLGRMVLGMKREPICQFVVRVYEKVIMPVVSIFV
jgi:glycosyltransferase involved in cell wall biosynthesis